MCIKHVNVCCHCGELMEPHWEEPLHSQCQYKKSEMCPMLQGCVNNDSCPSWLLNIFKGLDEVEDESQEVTEAQEEIARAKYEAYKKEFAESHYTRRSLPIRNFGEFLETALEDIPLLDLEDNSDDEFSLADNGEEGLWSGAGSLGSLSGSMLPSTAPPGLAVRFGVNPKLLSQENVPTKEDKPDPKSESPSAENLAMEYKDLVAAIWACFFPTGSDPDTEVSQ